MFFIFYWQPKSQLWVIDEETASLACFDLKVTENLVTRLVPDARTRSQGECIISIGTGNLPTQSWFTISLYHSSLNNYRRAGIRHTLPKSGWTNVSERLVPRTLRYGTWLISVMWRKSWGFRQKKLKILQNISIWADIFTSSKLIIETLEQDVKYAQN